MEQLDGLLQEFHEIYNEQMALKDKLKLIGEKRKDMEDQIIQIMTDNGISSVPCGNYTFIAQPKKTVKKPNKKELVKHMSNDLGTTQETLEEAMKKAEKHVTIEFKTQLKPLRTGITPH